MKQTIKSILLALLIAGSSLATVAYATTFVVPQGGTGQSSFPVGNVVVGNGQNPLQSILASFISNWVRFNNSGIHPATTTDQVLIGASATTSKALLDVEDNAFISGNVGIGTTTPWGTLSINKYSSGVSSSPLFVISTSTGSGATSTPFIVSSIGNVGIGTTTPDAPLDIESSGTTSSGSGLYQVAMRSTGGDNTLSGYTIWNPSSNAGSFFTFAFAGNAATGTRLGVPNIANGLLMFSNNSAINPAAFIALGTSNPAPVYFSTNDIVRQTLLSNGNVGIGTTTPWGKFSINNSTNDPAGQPLFVVASSTSNSTTTVFTVANNSNVGIGTTSPNWKLQIAGTRPLSVLSDTSAGVNAQHWFTSSQGGNYYIGTSSDALNATSTYLTILNGGKVGIGTTTPTRIFSVAGTAMSALFSSPGNTQATLETTGAGTNLIPSFQILSPGRDWRLESNRGAVGSYEFSISDCSIGCLERLTVTTAGNVGIGTTTPNWKLQVAGTRPFSVLSDTSAGLDAKHWFTTSQGGNFYIGTSSDALTATSTYLSIKNGGFVGIGTTNPSSSLHIDSLTAATTLTLNTTGSAVDFVNATVSGNSRFKITKNAAGDVALSTFSNSNLLLSPSKNLGIGTTSPYATTSIQSNSSFGDAFVVATSSGAWIGGYDNDGHQFTSGPAPAISVCGTGSPSVVGDDQSGTITTATAATACTMTFSKAYRIAPTCTVSDDSLVGFADVNPPSTTAVTFGISSALTGGHLYYSCSYHQ